MKIIKNYRNDDILRHSFNQLALDTFGLDFEDWYQNGYWTDRYLPYSILIDGEVCANVSVNRTDFMVNGEIKRWLQLGTVMTAEDCRHQGLIRLLMEEIEKDYAGTVDGMYLFANDEVLEFYPKFGFQTAKQYEYIREIADSKDNESDNNSDIIGELGGVSKSLPKFVPTPLIDKAGWDMLQDRILHSASHSSLEMIDNSQLNMFYVSKFMQDCIYYCEDLDTYVIAEQDWDSVVIHAVISNKKQDLVQISDSIAAVFVASNTDGDLPLRQVRLGFTPEDPAGFLCRELDQTDSMFFVKGDVELVEDQRMMIPTLAHA